MQGKIKHDNYRLGIDIGGTFTDVILMSEQKGLISSYKVDTTPKNLEECFVRALNRSSNEHAPESITHILHATTVATNTVLESKGAKSALVVTKGFRDILEIARQRRPSLYELNIQKAKPLIPRRMCFEVKERMDWQGKVSTPLTEKEMKRVSKALKASGAESIVISFLFSFLNPVHEDQVKSYLKKHMPEKYIVTSAEVIPEFREFERASTASLVGYLKPIFEKYIDRLTGKLKTLGHEPQKLLIMNSAGGVMSPDSAQSRPHALIESGPAAGVIAATFLSKELHIPNVISFDMGGTTAKASLVVNNTYKTTTEYEIGMKLHQSLAVRYTGYPIKTPVIDLIECGAGGGSIARVDDGGILKVGPKSAGADPGPSCYGKGGSEPTVTDANLILGRLNPNYFVGGESKLNLSLARKIIDEKIAQPLRLSTMEAAAGIIEVVNAHMVRTLRVVSVSRGYDPRDFTMIAFGGAGPLHAADLSLELDIPHIIIPKSPGVFSAQGLLWSDLRADFSTNAHLPANTKNSKKISSLFKKLESDATRWFSEENVSKKSQLILRSADMRYPMQNYELNVPLPSGKINQTWLKRSCEAFHSAHHHNYSYRHNEEDVQIVNLRITAVGKIKRFKQRKISADPSKPKAAMKGKRRVHFQSTGKFTLAPIYERNLLCGGNQIMGPAVVEQADSTILIPPRFNLMVDAFGRAILNRNTILKSKNLMAGK